MQVERQKDGQYRASVVLRDGTALDFVAETAGQAITWLLWKVKKHNKQAVSLPVHTRTIHLTDILRAVAR